MQGDDWRTEYDQFMRENYPRLDSFAITTFKLVLFEELASQHDENKIRFTEAERHRLFSPKPIPKQIKFDR